MIILKLKLQQMKKMLLRERIKQTITSHARPTPHIHKKD